MTDKRRKTSGVWQVFEPIDNEFATCNICAKKLSYKTSISNLKKHMQCKHSAAVLQEGAYIITQESTNVVDSEQPSTSSNTLQFSIVRESQPHKKKISNMPIQKKQEAMQPKEIPRIYAQCKDNINKKLLCLFIKDLQPFSVVTDEGFKEFVRALNPYYEIPSRRVISNTFIPAIYEECFNDTKALLEKAETFCLTIDTWTCMNTTKCIGITAHSLDNEFNFKSVFLECCPIPEVSNTTTNLANALRKIISDWEMDEKEILLTVTDNNDANIKKAIETELKWEHFGCLAHTINLIVKDSLVLQPIQIILNKIRAIVYYFKTNSVANDELRTHQIQTGEIPLKLILDVKGQWNSLYYMIQRFLELEEPIKTISGLLHTDIPTLVKSEWQIINELYQILKPFEDIIKTITAEHYCAASLVVPILNGLNNVVVALNGKHWSNPNKQVLLLLLKGLSERLGNIEQNNTLFICTFLDPRFKTLTFSNAKKTDSVKKLIIEAVSSKISENDITEVEDVPISETNVEEEEFSIWYSFDKRVSESQSKGTSVSRAIIEVQRYLQDPVISRHQNPLSWWNTNKAIYPHLGLLAQEFLCCLACSVPCERLYSKAGQVFCERRSRLNEDENKMLLFINSNMKL
ncbi:hypothetical protein ILUMI_03859 [Ignelater luminosus]|uniref:BED-type domain-containing protein n=1 Tax=Ignelater luminosus TaxID=2038154 RepID=A0A8K0DDW1_IGNLU|nr:hypothetical protein ILUMI_03859 [Ignelater luminosus]